MRDAFVNQAQRYYQDANTWQIERIREGISATRDGRVRPAEAVFAAIADKHGWDR